MSKWFQTASKLAPWIVLPVVGLTIGLLVPTSQIRAAAWSLIVGSPPEINGDHDDEEHDDHGEHDDHDDHGSEIVELTQAAYNNLGFQLQPVSLTNYQVVVSVPAIVRERPGVSDHAVTSRFEGMVAKIFTVPGQALRENDVVCELQLTGDQLASAQSSLLDTVQQIDILERKIQRLKPLAENGGIAQKNLLELQYEQDRLRALQNAREQELLVRGLSTEQVNSIVDNKQLVRTVQIRVPENLMPEYDRPADSASAAADPWQYTIENLYVSPGSIVQPGQPLCSLAYHATLFVEGQAFEQDLPALRLLLNSQNSITMELNTIDGRTDELTASITRLDNHVDEQTNSYRFYLPVENSVLEDTVDAQGRRFRSWKIRPGQRGHVNLPTVQKYKDVFELPRAAVAIEGVEAFVFRELHHDDHADHGHSDPNHDHDEGAENLGRHNHEEPSDNEHEEHSHDDHDDHDDHADIFLEMQAVPVRVLMRTNRVVIVASDGDLHPGDEIATSSAYQLWLAAQEGSGGGHHHDHDH